MSILIFFFFLAPPPPPELESGQSSPTKTLDPVARLCRQKPTETDKRAPRSRGGGGAPKKKKIFWGGVSIFFFFFFLAPPPPPPPELESGQSSPTKTLDPVARLCRQKPTETDKRAPRSRGGGGGRQKKKKKKFGGGGGVNFFFFFFWRPPPPQLESGQSSPTKTLDPVARLCRKKPTETDKRQKI